MQVARDRQKSYADKRHKPFDFQVGEKVMLKVSPWKGVIRFGKRGKLNPRYIGSFKILAKISPIAYRRELPQELSSVHNVFHVCNLKKCLFDETLFIPLEEIQVDDKLNFVEELVEIIDCESTTISPIPKSNVHALRDLKWQKAMIEEYNALITNGTWVLVPRLANVNVVRSMWLFRHKFHADGSLSRYKARLVANGRMQQLGIDCDETFSLVVKPETIHTVLSLVVSRQWPIH
ncbi:putative reverse transcriptase domain-containing protein [Tanacetum coccineum]